jgi:poly(hydroxyalkanoate) depolymerase family esterase
MKSFQRLVSEATRLTRDGRLGEATMLLRDLFGRKDAEAGAAAPPAKPPPPAGEASPRFAPPPLSGTLHDLAERIGSIGAEFGFPGVGLPPHPTAPPDIAPGAQFLARSHTGTSGTRDYKLYVPASYRGSPAPLVVMLHGCHQSADDFAAGTQMNAAGEEHTCLVCYPEQSGQANVSRCWNWFQPQDQRRGEGEPALIAGIVGDIASQWAVDPTRMYVAGLSAGGSTAAIMSEAYPELFAAIGVHSGVPFGSAADLASALMVMRHGGPRRGPDGTGRRLTPAIVFHGDRDTTVSAVNGDGIVAALAPLVAAMRETVTNGGADGDRPWTLRRWSDASGRVLLEQWVIHGGGHAWSGGSPAGSFTDPRGPDATAAMLRFFLQHRSTRAG